jgi:hydroxyacylglutathione hydrolase
MQITDHVILAASGRLGFGLTSPYDCNVYAITAGDTCILIDAGSGLATDQMLARLTHLNVASDRISSIFLTHSHADHAAGAPALSELTGARVHAPRRSAAALRAGDRQASHFDAARAAGNYPTDFRYPTVDVAVEVGDGDQFSLGDLTLEALDSPGHAYDHTTYLLRGPGQPTLLFCGDLILTDGRVLLQATADCRIDLYAATIKRLADLDITGLMPGHGAFTLTDGASVLARATKQFAALVPPPSLR